MFREHVGDVHGLKVDDIGRVVEGGRECVVHYGLIYAAAIDLSERWCEIYKGGLFVQRVRRKLLAEEEESGREGVRRVTW